MLLYNIQDNTYIKIHMYIIHMYIYKKNFSMGNFYKDMKLILKKKKKKNV